VFGGGAQDLSTCAVYSFTPQYASTVQLTVPPNQLPTSPAPGTTTGGHPIAAQLLSGFPLDLGSTGTAPSLADDFGLTTGDAVTGVVDLGTTSVAPHPIAVQLLSGNPLNLGLTTSFATVLDDFGSTSDPVVDVINLGTAP
jgi:hypothetical protein